MDDFHRGATLPTAPTLGLADTSDLGPTAGNGFFRRWPDDLALFQDNDITDVRLTLDWARLQPKPGVFDGGWVEQYAQILLAAEAIDLRIWATMYDGNVPRWFDNEGGVDDGEALVTWWPRFVERVAERFGDLVAGWVPFAAIPAGAPDRAWSDTWGILGGGGPPVISSIRSGDGGSPSRLAGRTDRIGLELDLDGIEDDAHPSDQELTDLAEHWWEAIGTAAAAADAPAAVCLSPLVADPDVGGRLVEAAVTAVRAAITDDVDVTPCFVDPGIAGPDRQVGLFDKDRAPLPALTALVAG